LEDWKKHCRLWFFRETAVFSLFCNTHDLDARPVRHFVRAVHGSLDRTKDLAREGFAVLVISSDLPEVIGLSDRIVVMNQQRIEQIGTPSEVYDRPATLFVAEFIGSPAMNILPVTRVPTAAGLQRVKLGDGTEIDTLLAAAALPKDGPLRIGLRPESVAVCAPGGGSTSAVVEFVEFLGDRTHVYLSLAGEDRIVALGAASLAARVGETVGIRFDPAGAHLFDAQGRNCRRSDTI